MNMKLKVRLSITLFMAILVLFPIRANAATTGEISKQLICQCDCTLVLGSCTHVECASREAMTAFINQEITRGKSGEDIIQSFVAQYGEQVLASPPKSGFTLAAWVTPFIAILAGGAVIYVALRRWVWQGTQSRQDVTVEDGEGNEKYRRQLEKELGEFSQESFR